MHEDHLIVILRLRRYRRHARPPLGNLYMYGKGTLRSRAYDALADQDASPYPLYTRFTGPMSLSLQACIQTFEA